MSYQAITDIIVSPQLSDLQLSATVKDSPNTSSASFSDFLMSFQKNEVKTDEKPSETMKKPEEISKKDGFKEESASTSRVEKGEKADTDEKVTEKSPVEEKSDEKIASKEKLSEN